MQGLSLATIFISSFFAFFRLLSPEQAASPTYALEGVAKDGVYVGKDAELYPCFDSEDYASEDRFFWNIVFAKSLEELEAKKAELEDAFYNCNYEKFTEELAPMAYWGGDTYYDVKITDDME